MGIFHLLPIPSSLFLSYPSHHPIIPSPNSELLALPFLHCVPLCFALAHIAWQLISIYAVPVVHPPTPPFTHFRRALNLLASLAVSLSCFSFNSSFLYCSYGPSPASSSVSVASIARLVMETLVTPFYSCTKVVCFVSYYMTSLYLTHTLAHLLALSPPGFLLPPRSPGIACYPPKLLFVLSGFGSPLF